MTAERFDIEVQDKVAKSIRTELTAIGTAATNTFTAVKTMKAELAGLSGANTSARSMAAGIREQARASNEAERAARSQIAAIKSVTDALQEQARAARDLASARGSAGAAPPAGSRPAPSSRGGGSAAPIVAGAAAAASGVRAATTEMNNYSSASKLASHHSINLAFQMQDLSMQMAMAAQSSRPLSMGLMALFQQGTQIQGIAMQSGASYKQLGMAMLEMMGIVKTVTAVEEAHALALATSKAAGISSSAAAAASNVAAAETAVALAVAQQALAVTALEAAAAQTALAVANGNLAAAEGAAAIASQAQAVAQRELGIASEAANAKTVRSITRLGRGGLIALAALVVGYMGARDAAEDLNETTSKADLTKGLGLTKKELKELEDVTVTTGDVIKGTFLAVGDAIPQEIKDALDDMSKAWDEAWDWAMGKVKDAGNYIIGSMVGAYRTLIKVWEKLPDAIGDLFFTAVNQAIEGINAILKASVDGINSFMDKADAAMGTDLFGHIDAPTLDKVKNEYAGAAKEVGDTAAAEMKKALGRDYLGEAGAALKKRILGVTRDRLKDQADKIIDDRPEKAEKKAKKAKEDHTAEKRAKALADVNRELDSQIHLLGFYGEALERESQFQAINNALLAKKISLSKDEEKVIRDKIMLIQEGKRVQAELNKIEEEANGPRRVYEAQMKAINIAVAENIISEEEAARRRQLAQNNLKRDSNPLFDYVKELQRAEKALGLYGKQLADVSRAQQLFDNAVANGMNTPGETARDYEKQAATERRDMELNDVFADIDPREATLDTNAFILTNHEEMYRRLAEMREENLISEEEANERRKNLDFALASAKISMMSDMFGTLAQLQSSSNRKVAAIGKAAAITQATIDGIVAVQAALKGPPGPPWSYAIAAATGVTAAVNVAKIAGIGFERGGYTGGGGNNETAGMVHRNEFVMDAVTTRNIGVPALEAMRRGARLSGGPANDNGGSSGRVIVHQHAGTVVEERRTTSGEIEIIARRVARDEAPKAVARDMMSGSNSHTSKAMTTSFGVKRNRS